MDRRAEERICLSAVEYARCTAAWHLVRGLTAAGYYWGMTPPRAMRETDHCLPRPVWWRSRARLAVRDLLTERR